MSPPHLPPASRGRGHRRAHGTGSPSHGSWWPPPAATATTSAERQARQASSPLTNLDHLDWLSVPVTPPAQAGHTTYRLAEEPAVGVLWTYAEPNPDGSFRHVGGGAYDPETDTWGQGAFNADDVSRAAVVYLRHWQATGARSSKRSAYEMLRGLTYLQTASGPNAGNVVLWMQPDGTLNPSADPVELPDPSDSDASFWLARTIWALGEGYAAFEKSDPAFARFLRDRLELSTRRGRPSGPRPVRRPPGHRRPAGAGLADRRRWRRDRPRPCSDSRRTSRRAAPARPAGPCAKLSEGIAELGGGNARSWPMGADPALGAVPIDVARLGLPDAGRPGCGLGGPGRPRPGQPGRARLVHVRPVAAHVGWPGQRPAAHPRRHLADRLRRRLAAAVAARHGRRHRHEGRRTASPGSWRRGTSAPTPPARRCTTRPPAGPSTASPARARSTTTPEPSPRSTGCSR